MKTLTWIAAMTLVAAAPLMQAQGTGGQEPGSSRQYHEQVKELRAQVDQILMEENAEFKALVEDTDKTFRELREIAGLRLKLIEGSEAAQAVVDEIKGLREQFVAGNPDQAPTPQERPRPELTEEQKAAIQQQREQFKEKAQALDALLTAGSERYAELLADPDKTREEVREMLRLRRELIAGSEEAQALADELQGMVAEFREAHPSVGQGHRPKGAPKHGIARVKAGLEAVQELRTQIDEILAVDSAEFAALLAKEDKTDEELEQLRDLRKELLAANEEAQQLAGTAGILRNRLRRHRRQAVRRRNQIRPGLGTDTQDQEETDAEAGN
ncbi:MAG: hypothetical protein HN742_24860 [Lentisphaerae bacterium]|jgi:hypothetical protein|nr:hypothetical protein [Lentisphaerota bacterium]MBT4815063.1 hypothetical protein [Lentisphaerota bacterium]MBT5608746.1 hypothetical protein [Lentisphaerota bacterium]MBT7054093.1 hypothetical protein [Lentisphaerota bacterium]MBT7845132.1 hypothetical protein [Lentisphaerota bacterium]